MICAIVDALALGARCAEPAQRLALHDPHGVLIFLRSLSVMLRERRADVPFGLTGGIVEIVIVNFTLDGMSEGEYEQMCAEVAPAFADVPGLASKVWLADRAEGIFGGVYAFVSGEAADEFLVSELFAGVGATPGLVNISVRRFGVLDSPTSVTRGLAPAAA